MISLDFLELSANVDGDEEGVVEVDGVGEGGLPEERDSVDRDVLLGQVGCQEAHLAPGAPRRLCREQQKIWSFIDDR